MKYAYIYLAMYLQSVLQVHGSFFAKNKKKPLN